VTFESLEFRIGTQCGMLTVGMGNISILSYIMILRAHDNCIAVVLQLSSYRLHIISGAFA